MSVALRDYEEDEDEKVHWWRSLDLDQTPFPPLPPGWRWTYGGGTFRPTAPKGARVPLADHPLAGDENERQALKDLAAWRKENGHGDGQT